MITVNYAWQTRRLPRPRRSELKALAARAAVLAGLPDTDWELDVRFVGDRAMAAANASGPPAGERSSGWRGSARRSGADVLIGLFLAGRSQFSSS